jgi:hypothetical protein
MHEDKKVTRTAQKNLLQEVAEAQCDYICYYVRAEAIYALSLAHC